MREVPQKSASARADLKPTEGYILTVDGKLKARYETETEAAAAGGNLKKRFPMIQVAVYDAKEGLYTPVDAGE